MMPNTNQTNKSNRSGGALLAVISFGLLILMGSQSSCKGDDHSPDKIHFIGTFYGFGEPTSSNVGEQSIDVGPSSYFIEFDYSDKHGNTVKLKLQEWEITREDGGSWSRPVIGTTITSEYFVDEYAKPIIFYGKCSATENKDSITIAGEINQGEYLKPIPFRIELNKTDLTFTNDYYFVKDSFDVCFDLRLEAYKNIRYCSTKKYFVNQMISQYEKKYGKKMTSKRRHKIMEMHNISD